MRGSGSTGEGLRVCWPDNPGLFLGLFQPCKGIHIVMFAGSKEGIEFSGTLCSGMGSGKQIVAPSQIM
jgi:hypothetical protein